MLDGDVELVTGLGLSILAEERDFVGALSVLPEIGLDKVDSGLVGEVDVLAHRRGETDLL